MVEALRLGVLPKKECGVCWLYRRSGVTFPEVRDPIFVYICLYLFKDRKVD